MTTFSEWFNVNYPGAGGGSGGGNMNTETYDPDEDGIVSKAEALSDGNTEVTASEAADAVSKSHEQNTDTGTTAEEFYIELDGAQIPVRAHIESTNNPHHVTKFQIGLGNVENIKNNLNATQPPTTVDDEGEGYSVGSRWIDVNEKKEYVCLDATEGAAIWQETTYIASVINSFLGLSDTPSTYNGSGGKFLRVSDSEDGIVFDTVPEGNEGDMRTDVYDPDKDGIVTKAEILSNGSTEVTASEAADAVGKAHNQNTDTGTTAEEFYIDTENANIPVRAHIENTNNPHHVTKSQIGLGNVENIKNNLNATVSPSSSNDSSEGYSVGSRWVNVDSKKEYVCLDATEGAAIWKETTYIADVITTFLGLSDTPDTYSGSGGKFVQVSENEDGLVFTESAPNDITALEILNKLKTVDGAGSGLDTDFIRGLPGDFTCSKNPIGFTKLPNGIIIQWGRVEEVEDELWVVFYPIVFPNDVLFITLSTPVRYNTHIRMKKDEANVLVEVTDAWFSFKGAHKEEADYYWIALGY